MVQGPALPKSALITRSRRVSLSVSLLQNKFSFIVQLVKFLFCFLLQHKEVLKCIVIDCCIMILQSKCVAFVILYVRNERK